MSERPWFPRPESEGDLLFADGNGGVRAQGMFELLHSGGEEWRSKVGVAGPFDGSAKVTTRLLSHGGWVFKTNLTWVEPAQQEALNRATAMGAIERGLNLWHPSKIWFAVRLGRHWLPMSGCSELVTLRSVKEPALRVQGWLDLLALGVRASREHGVGLDLNPANFARESDKTQLWYVDDELYGPLNLTHLTSFLVARMPEEPAMEEPAWRELGVSLQETFSKMCRNPGQWLELLQGLEDYPLHESFHARRAALAEGLLHHNEHSKSATRHKPRRALVCVLADVHGNEPALDAVLKAARSAGAESFLFLGDAVGYGPHPAECVRKLAELRDATHIRGNHDNAIGHGRWVEGTNQLARDGAAWTRAALSEEELRWLRELPTEHLNEGFLAVHGAPKDPHRFLAYVYELTYEENMEVVRKSGRSLCFYGHTHVQLVHRSTLGQTDKLGAPAEVTVDPKRHLLVNPGSVGQPRDGIPEAGYALWDQREGTIHLRRIAYDIERTRRDLGRYGLPSALSERLTVGR